ncbi:MAG: DUF1573 domain-containing protein [Desulfobacteraceae bacterium]|nr:DUF1573 domain-containing protein [Desulfobacteraceae bacterium]
MLRKILFCFFPYTLLILMSTSLYSAPKLIAQKSFFDFGSIREGMDVPVSFTITNTGGDMVHILEVRTFAACVQSRPLDKHNLAPGESMELDYIFESLGYGGISINKTIEIHYNNKKLSPLRLQVKGKVLPLETYQAPLGELTYNFFILVDIRPPEHFMKEHIIGATNVPYEKIVDWAAHVAKRISEEIVIYLYSEDGIKSDQAAKMLRKKGYPQYISLVGGLKEWRRQHGKRLLVPGRL